MKELVPIVMACALWGCKWQGSSILIHCDNEAVVSVVCKRDKFDAFFAVHFLCGSPIRTNPDSSQCELEALTKEDQQSLLA